MFALTAASLGTGRGGGRAALRHSSAHPRGPEALAAATLSSDLLELATEPVPVRTGCRALERAGAGTPADP